MIPEVTYVCPIIQDKYISRLIYTLYKYSKPNSFRFILIDQCKNGVSPEVWAYIKDKVHLYIHPIRNLGYAKACNEGIIHGLHWKTPYICLTNDDIEVLDERWMEGIRATFELSDRIMAVCPMSPRVAGWGYGVGYNPEVIPFKETYTKEDYDFLLNGDFSQVQGLPKTFPRNLKGTVVDGAAFIMTYFKREAFEKVGLLEEHFFPGSGEDYDWNARAYQKDLRVVSSSLAWVWHHWTKSKDLFGSGELEDPYYKPEDHPYWNNFGDIWPDGFDVWARKPDGTPYRRIPEVFVDQI